MSVRNVAEDLVALSAVMTGLSVNAMNGEIVVLHSTKTLYKAEKRFEPMSANSTAQWENFPGHIS